MFTGIIENKGIVKKVIAEGSNKSFIIESSLTKELKVDQSVAHNGVCLTVESIYENTYQVTAINETLLITNLKNWIVGSEINLERSVLANSRIDGHFVQGHVDAVATCVAILDKKGSWELSFEIDKKFTTLIIEKGSISINGISLTIFNVTRNTFTVAIVPYTYSHTNIHLVNIGDFVNVEFDLIGKYINRIKSLEN